MARAFALKSKRITLKYIKYSGHKMAKSFALKRKQFVCHYVSMIFFVLKRNPFGLKCTCFCHYVSFEHLSANRLHLSVQTVALRRTYFAHE